MYNVTSFQQPIINCCYKPRCWKNCQWLNCYQSRKVYLSYYNMYGTHSQESFSRIVQCSSVSAKKRSRLKNICNYYDDNFNWNIISLMRNTVWNDLTMSFLIHKINVNNTNIGWFNTKLKTNLRQKRSLTKKILKQNCLFCKIIIIGHQRRKYYKTNTGNPVKQTVTK